MLDDHDTICYGKIRPSNDNNTIISFDKAEKEFEFFLNKKDLYKDLKILNYTYGSCFQKIKTIKTNDFECIEAEIEWDGEMVSFLDCCLQTFLTNYCIRKLMIPTEIEYFAIDPNILLKEIRKNRMTEVSDGKETNIKPHMKINQENYCLFRSEYRVRYYRRSEQVIGPGIHIRRVAVNPIPISQELVPILDSHEFVANEDLMAFDDNYKHYIDQYIDVSFIF